MDWKVILLIISGSLNAILLIRQFPELVRDLIRLAIRIANWLRERPVAIRKWYWWRKCRPSWRIADFGKVNITCDKEGFRIEFPLVLELKSRIDKYKTAVDCGILLDVYHKGKGWEKIPYRLSSTLVDPNLSHLTLPPRESVSVGFLCGTVLKEEPCVGDTVICKVIDYMRAGISIHHLNLWGRLKKEGKDYREVTVLSKLGDAIKKED